MEHTKHRTIRCLALLAVAGLCLPALGQDSASVDSEQAVPQAAQGENHLPITLTAGGSEQFKTDINSGGEFSLARFRTGLGVPIRFDDDWALNTAVKYELDSFSFDGSVGDPWHNINVLTAVSLLQYRLDDQWMIYGGPIIRTAAESSADWGMATRAGMAAGFNYKVDEKLTVGVVVVVIGQMADHVMFAPLPTVNWQFADDWKLVVGVSDLATGGYGAEAVWDFNQQWQFTFGGQYHKNRFRIDGSSTGNVNGIGQESALTLTAAATWVANQTVSVTGFVGMATGGRLREDDNMGNDLANTHYSTAPIIGGKVDLKF